MTPEQPRLDPNQMHDHMWVDDGLYVLGCLERRVTLYSQQVRALNLIYALNHLQVISPGGTLLIVGGGVAGLTAAAGAARLGCRVILLEREKELLHLQRNNKKRWVHPHIYDWPAPDSTRSDAGLPLLNWDAEFAGEVATRILDEFEALPERKLITVHLNAQLIDLGEGPTRHVFWRANGNHDERVLAVVLAVGFGLEREVPGVDFTSYWQDDALDQAPVKNRGKILISGSGDGGLIDVLRARLRDFRHDKLVDDLVGDPRLDPVKVRLLEIEEKALRLERTVKKGNESLYDDYKALSASYEGVLSETVDAQIKSRLRDGVDVVLNGRGARPFSLGASVLSRFLVSRLYFKFNLPYQSGGFAAPTKSSAEYAVKFKFGTAEKFHRIVCRHGPESVLKSDFSSVWDSYSSRLLDLATLDQTRWPIYGDAFGPLPSRRVSNAPAPAPAPVPVPASVSHKARPSVRDSQTSYERPKPSLVRLMEYFTVGAAEGEQQLLARVYVPNDEMVELLSPVSDSPRILKGRKGTGKTALIKYASIILVTSGIPSLVIRPMDIPDLAEVSASHAVGPLTGLMYRAILGAIALQIPLQLETFLSDQDRVSYAALIESRPISERANNVATLVTRLARPLSPTVQTKAHGAMAVDLVGDGRAFYIFIDDTDQVASTGTPDQLNRIWAFLLAARELARSISNARVIITLREEVWRRLTRDSVSQRDQADHFALLIGELSPTRAHLHAIVNRRLLLAAQAAGVSARTPYEPFFAGTGANMPQTTDHRAWHDLVVLRARERPRDAIQLIAALAKRANRRHAEKIAELDLHSEMPEYSTQRVSILFQEVGLECPQVQEVVRAFAHVRFDYESFRMTAEAIKSHLLSLPSRFGIILFGRSLTGRNDIDAFELWRFLFEVGVVNARVADDREADKFRHIFPHEDPNLISKANWNSMQGMVWEINPAYRDYLISQQDNEIHRAGLPPRRTPQKRSS